MPLLGSYLLFRSFESPFPGSSVPSSLESSLPEMLGAPARARDAARMGDLNKLVAVIEVYNADNGEYPQKSSCTESMDEISVYLFGQNAPEDPSGAQDFVGPDGVITCESGFYYQYFGSNVYAVWSKLEDSSKGYADQLFADLDEMLEFEKQDGGQYYVVVNESAVDPFEDVKDILEVKPVTTSGGIQRI
jgi:hypothetical protein